MAWIFVPFRKKGTNRIILWKEALVSSGSGSRLLRVPRTQSKDHVNPVNPDKQYFFIRLKCYRKITLYLVCKILYTLV
jgi:hypothetical protein